VDLDDAILLLRNPRLGRTEMILAAKLAARELGPVVFVDGDEVWNTESMTKDEEWIAFAGFLRSMVRRRR
jgi:D-aminopeptidase